MSLLRRVVTLALRSPRVTLGVWLVVTVLLAGVGLDVQSQLTESAFVLPGTPSGEATALQNARFGESIEIPVLLHGPAGAVREQSSRLERVLGREPATTVLAPFGRGQSALAPRAGVVMLVVSVRRPLKEGIDVVAPLVRREVDATVRAPVRAAVTGVPVIGADLKQQTFAAATSAEKIAVVVLVVVLLLVFGTPGAALVPAGFGLATVLSSYGVLWLLAHVIELDSVAAPLCSMMGLALGVDYSLLLVSRFREELARGGGSREAAAAAALTAGRTVMFAGGALVSAMLVALVVATGVLLLSAIVAVILTALLSMLAAITAAPAALCLLGDRVERWPLRAGRRRGVAALTAPLRRRPRALAGVILVVLLIGAVPALALRTGAPGVGELPAGTRALSDFQTVARIMGPGWATPFEVIAARQAGPITTKPLLHALDRFQSRLAADPQVAAVIGPGELNTQLAPVTSASGQLGQTERALSAAATGASRLRHGLSAASGGLRQLDTGLARAAMVASGLSRGSRRAASGSEQLAAALGSARIGAQSLTDGLAHAAGGSARLRAGLATARSAAERIAAALAQTVTGLRAALPRVQQLHGGLLSASGALQTLEEPATATQTQLASAFSQLSQMTVGKLDPRYRAAITAVAEADAAASGRDPRDGRQLNPAYNGLVGAIGQAASGTREAAIGTGTLAGQLTGLTSGLAQLAGGASRLQNGLQSLEQGQRQLADGLRALNSGGGQLSSGIAGLQAASVQLANGLAALHGGTSQLAGGLGSGSTQTARLANGIDQAAHSTGRLNRQLSTSPAGQVQMVQRRSPGLFSSGYLALAALDGAHANQRTAASFAINLNNGGNAASILIIPTAKTPRALGALRARITATTDRLASNTGLITGVGGYAAQILDYGHATFITLFRLIVALGLVSLVLLTILFRSPLLAALTVVLNLLTVAVSFAVLTLCFQGARPLGGPGYIDAVAITGMYTVIFGLSIDYEVFLLARIREHHLAGDDTTSAIENGLERTARVVTGAAAIMIGVFTAFSFVAVATVREFGVGLAVAVLLDATIIRLLLLPALMRIAGDRCWSIPPRLDRMLPILDLEHG